jgi:hypothetical protein
MIAPKLQMNDTPEMLTLTVELWVISKSKIKNTLTVELWVISESKIKNTLTFELWVISMSKIKNTLTVELWVISDIRSLLYSMNSFIISCWYITTCISLTFLLGLLLNFSTTLKISSAVWLTGMNYLPFYFCGTCICIIHKCHRRKKTHENLTCVSHVWFIWFTYVCIKQTLYNQIM